MGLHHVMDRVTAAVSDPALTAGALIELPRSFLSVGNLGCDHPMLSILYVDELGRVWKERHAEGEHALICLADLRVLGR